jgi:hypothetical protein
MTDETRIFRTVGIPLVIAFILLFVMPKMCARAVLVSKERQVNAEHTGGLHIESSRKPVTYPEGLDPERIRYLVEVNPQFSTPSLARLSKSGAPGGSPSEEMLLAALRKLGYLETAPDGVRTLTRDALLHLDGMVDEGTSWSFLIAKREFRSVTAIETEGGSARAAFAWQWQRAAVGREMMAASPKRHEAKAELTNATGRWTLVQISELDNELE